MRGNGKARRRGRFPATERRLWPAWACRGCGATFGPDNVPGGRDGRHACYCDACATALTVPADGGAPWK